MWIALLAMLLCSCVPAQTRPSNLDAASRSEPFGFGGPIVLQDASSRHLWVAACFARRDSDGDGKLEVHVGRHGDTFGDELLPYLFTRGAPPLAIDEYVGSSPDRRFVAFVLDRGLWVLDSSTGQRQDLSALGANSLDDGNDVLSHRAVSFSDRGEALIARQRAGLQELILLNLRSGGHRVLFQSPRPIWRAGFLDDDAVQVLLLPQGHDEFPAVASSIGARFCRGAPASYSTFGTHGTFEKVRVDLPKPRGRRLPIERMLSNLGLCSEEGLPALASSEDEQHFLLASGFTRWNSHHGPLRWSAGPHSRRNCPKQEDD